MVKKKNTGSDTRIAIFRGKDIRKTIHNNEWWFSVVDVVEALTDSVNPRDYWYKMKIRVKDGGFGNISGQTLPRSCLC